LAQFVTRAEPSAAQEVDRLFPQISLPITWTSPAGRLSWSMVLNLSGFWPAQTAPTSRFIDWRQTRTKGARTG